MLPTLARILAVLTLAAAASAQTVLYQTQFDDLGGWTVGGSNLHWNADNTPQTFSQGPFHSAPNSLNCNDGSTHHWSIDCSVDSPPIALPSTTNVLSLSFWCAIGIEEDDCTYEARHVKISNDGFQTLLSDTCLRWGDCGGNFSPWHQHTLPLSPGWGTVQVRFYFDTKDFLWGNAGPGWFVDDFVVQSECAPSVPYCVPKMNSAGCFPTIFTTGSPSYTGQGADFLVQSASTLNQHPGILIWSLGAASIPFGGGTLCLAPQVNRTPGQGSGGSPFPPTDCSGSYSFHFTPALMQANGLVPGTVVFAQYWSRDTGYSAPDNIGLSFALRFTVCE
jgi:hypothetical protein